MSDRTNRPKTVPFYRTLKSVQRSCPWITMETSEKKEESLKDSETLGSSSTHRIETRTRSKSRGDEDRAQFPKYRFGVIS